MAKSIIEKELDELSDDIKSNHIKSKLIKKKFIEEIKNGLGEQIKEMPNEIIILPQKKPTFKEKLINFFKLF